MATKGGRGGGDKKAEWKAVGEEAKTGGDDGGGRGGGRGKGAGIEGAPWSKPQNREGNGDERRQGKGGGGGGKGGKGGKAEGGDNRWAAEDKGGGWTQQGERRGGGGGGGQQSRGRGGGGFGQVGGDDYYEEGGYGGGGGGGYGGGDASYGAGAGSYGAAGYGAAPWHSGAQDGTWEEPAPVQPPPPKVWTEYMSPDGAPYYYNSRTGLTQWDRPEELNPPKPVVEKKPERDDAEKGGRGSRMDNERGDDRRNQGEGRGGNRQGGQGGGGDRREGGGGARDGGDREQRQQRGGQGRNKKEGDGRGGGGGGGGKKDQGKEVSEFGPPGCNLFVFHLPDDWVDDDLNEYFAPHGNVISAKVMKELGTGRSRGFGFVSYEERIGAATAIKKMQGYKILGKRLKVEFKKGEGQEGLLDGNDNEADEGSSGAKKSYPDDERLIGYLRAISAKNVVQSLKESEGAGEEGDEAALGSAAPRGGDEDDDIREEETAPNDD